MKNMENNYRVATPEEKENIMKKLTPHAREGVKEIYRVLPTADMPTADDMKKAKTPEEKREILRKIMLSLRRHRLTCTTERHRLTCTLESTEGNNMGSNHLSAKAEEVYFLRKMLSPFERSDKEMHYTSYRAGAMTAARLRCIGVRLNTRIKAIRLYPAEIMDTAARLRYIDARLKAGGYTRA